MIPQISQAPGVVQLVLNFLQALEQQGFTGDMATSYADRLTMSTDNSIYQLLPDAVVFPRSTADVALIARLAAEPLFSSLIFTPRGGGTGTNGQALNQGIIVDMSRYMSRIIEINPQEGWVRVEAGVRLRSAHQESIHYLKLRVRMINFGEYSIQYYQSSYSQMYRVVEICSSELGK